MTKEEAVRYIIEYGSDLPVKQALACHMAATDVQEFGIEEWVEWKASHIMSVFKDIIEESSANSLDKVRSYTIGEELLDELIQDGYITTENEDQERIDYVVTMENMRDSMLDGMDALRTYYEIQDIIRNRYYGLY